MRLLHEDSLAATVDAVNEAEFLQAETEPDERRRTADWIASRQGLPGSYHGLFAPTAQDLSAPYRMFTGEQIRTDAGLRHVLGEEACRALLLLRRDSSQQAAEARERATQQITRKLLDDAGRNPAGFYCCGKCSVSLWRHACRGSVGRGEEELTGAIKLLRQHRDGKGRWRRFPFYYSISALAEFEGVSGVVEELRYAAPSVQRALKGARAQEPYLHRRQVLAERVLAMC
ncbi:MAG: hypothetical protein ACOC93_06085 [Planctomycetota bacterium]